MKNLEENNRICPACGENNQRATAKFCATCGGDLRQDYVPLDALRASYRMHEKPKRAVVLHQPEKIELFVESKNDAATTAMAFLVYSLVPFLGILFSPGALILGGVGLLKSYQEPHIGGRDTAIYSLSLGTVIAGIQVLLWWLLYVVPELSR